MEIIIFYYLLIVFLILYFMIYLLTNFVCFYEMIIIDLVEWFDCSYFYYLFQVSSM